MADPLDTIRACVRAARASGLEIVTGDWGVSYDSEEKWISLGSCCPLGACLVGRPVGSYDMLLETARLLGVSPDWVVGFIHAIDDQGVPRNLEGYAESYRQGYLAGVELYREAFDGKP